MSNWYGVKRTAAALGLTLAFAIAAFADDPGFPAPPVSASSSGSSTVYAEPPIV